MANNYNIGDIVEFLYPHKNFNGPDGYAKPRPGLIIASLSVGDFYVYKIAKITGTTKYAETRRGMEISKNSELAKTLKLTKDSFIDLDAIIDVTQSYIFKFVSKFPYMEDIKDRMDGLID